VLDYLRRDMTHAGGGVYSAEDADSAVAAGGELKEGWFYLWSYDELASVLGGADTLQARLAVSHYGVKPRGNADLSPRSDPHGEFSGLNVLRAVRTEAETAAALGLAPDEAAQQLADARRKLHAARAASRIRPRLDNKVISAWNGLAISALARASRALAAFPGVSAPRFPVEGGPPAAYGVAAAAAARFIRDRLYGATLRGGCVRLRASANAFCAALRARCGDAHAAALLLRRALRRHRLRR
jgi:hypothetical protein